MDFIKEVAFRETSETYYNFVIIQALEITQEEYLKHEGTF
jgi:hypothetical protein